jgi:hypothetical protein
MSFGENEDKSGKFIKGVKFEHELRDEVEDSEDIVEKLDKGNKSEEEESNGSAEDSNPHFRQQFLIESDLILLKHPKKILMASFNSMLKLTSLSRFL